MGTYTIMILEDGDIWSPVDGCEIITISEAAMNMLDEGYQPKDIPQNEVHLSIKLKSYEKDG
jgi:hypothetical protein